MAEKRKIQQENTVELDSSITTLLFILWHQDHYAVIRVDIKSRRVTLWDALFDPKLWLLLHIRCFGLSPTGAFLLR